MNAPRWRDEPMCSSRAALLGALIQLLCRLPRLSTWAWPGPCAAGDSARPAQGRMVWILGRPHSATRDRRSTGALAAISPASRRGAVNRYYGACRNFSDQYASRMRRRHDLTCGCGLGFQTAEFLPIVASMQVRQSAIPLQIVCGKILRQAPQPCPAAQRRR